MEGKRRAVLFDADNTLYRTKATAKPADLAGMRVLYRHCRLCAPHCSPASLYAEFREIVKRVRESPNPTKRTRQHSYSLLASRHGIPQRFVATAYAAFKRSVLQKLKPMPGVLRFLKAAKHQGFKLCVLTEDRNDLASAKLRKLRLRKFFSLVVTSDTVGTMKPNNRYFDFAYAKLRVKPSDCIVFGDSFDKDLAYPKAKGAFTILIGAKDHRADKSVASYAGLRKYLR